MHEKTHDVDCLEPDGAAAYLPLHSEQLPGVIWTTDGQLHLTSILGMGASRLGVSPTTSLGLKLAELFAQVEGGEVLLAAHRDALRGRERTFQLTRGGSDYQGHVRPLYDAHRRYGGCICVLVENGAHRVDVRAGETYDGRGELREMLTKVSSGKAASPTSDQWYRTIFEKAAVGIAVSELDAEGATVQCNIVQCNAALRQMLGYRDGSPTGSPLQELIVEADRPRLRRRIAKLRDRGRAMRCEARLVHQAGNEVWGRWNGSLVQDGRQQSFLLVSVIEDLTEKKLAERRVAGDEQLLRRLLDLQERERGFVAYELHDGLMQSVIAAHMTIQAAHHLQGEALQQRLDEAAHSLMTAMNVGRRLIGELKPLSLEGSGIEQSLQFLISEFEADGQLEIEYQHRATIGRLDPLIQENIFRIAKDALTNVKRHSQSGCALVRLTQVARRHLIMEIQDWGVGFDPQQVPSDRFGLESIRERARLLGGGATIESQPGAGTRISVKLPLNDDEKETNWHWSV